MTHTQAVRTIGQAYQDLLRLGLYDGFHEVPRRLLDMNLQSERQHRKGRPTGTNNPRSFSVVTAAKYFVVHHLLHGLTSDYTVDDILNIRNEVLYAQAYARKHREALEPWAKIWGPQFEQIDYAKLMQAA